MSKTGPYRVYKDGIGMKDKVESWAVMEETKNVNVKYVEIGLEIERMLNDKLLRLGWE